MISRAYYSAAIDTFLKTDSHMFLGKMTRQSAFAVDLSQRDAWLEEFGILHSALQRCRRQGKVYFEYSVPRLGKRIDVLAVVNHVVFIFEFKVGESEFSASATDQVFDYALDLKNFHETSHSVIIAPVLIATRASTSPTNVVMTPQSDRLLYPIHSSVSALSEVIEAVLNFTSGQMIDAEKWELGRYCPTPTIIEAAMALYGGHSVSDISRSDASATNLSETSAAVSQIIRNSRERSQKSICFVTGVPGAGKTLVGLNIATQHMDRASDLYSVFLSGNGPLVAILREALARDKVRREKEAGRKQKKGEAISEVKLFVQNVHHFRDECLLDSQRPPVEHVALFDEAQRAWNLEQTANFMLRKKNCPNFRISEPEFLISCLDRHNDWAVVVCLVGGGQEINTGEAGISEWIESLRRSFPHWGVHISSRLYDAEYGAGAALESVAKLPNVSICDQLHLGVSMRSFRAEKVSSLVKDILDYRESSAKETLKEIGQRYPITLTRDLRNAKAWLKHQARGSERYGIVVSSQAQRLKPHAIDVRSPMDPIHWFLDGKQDVRSSYYLEDVATEFHVQGLELDWACVTWDADFRYGEDGWEHRSFVGDQWNQIRKPERQSYLKNAYRVLLTRARQGMVIVVPHGDDSDPTRHPSFYDPTFNYLKRIGMLEI